MAPHTTPPSGNRRHLTSANAGAFIRQSSLASSQAPIAARASLLPARAALFHGPHNLGGSGGNRSIPSLDALVAGNALRSVEITKSGQAVHQFRDRDGRPATRSFDCRHTPSPAARRAVSYANPTQAHAAPRIHGASR